MARGKDVEAGTVTVEAKALAGAMKHAAAVIESRNTIPILSNVRLTAAAGAMEIVTSDLDVEFRQKLPVGGTAELATTVDARRLAALASAADSGEHITLSMDDTRRLVVKSGRSRWTLPTLPADDFPVLHFEGGEAALTVPGKDLAAAIGRVIWALNTEMHRQYLHGPLLHAEGGKAALVGCQGNYMVRVVMETEHPAGAPEVILGPKFCRALQALAADNKAAVTLTWDAAKARLEIGNVTLTGKMIDGIYPDYRRVIPPEGSRVVVDPATLRGAIRRVGLVASEKTRAVKIVRDDSKLTLSVTSPEGGTAREEVPADAEVGHEAGFNARFLEQMLDAIGGDSVEIHQTDAGSPALIRRVVPDGAIGVVMPMRI